MNSNLLKLGLSAVLKPILLLNRTYRVVLEH